MSYEPTVWRTGDKVTAPLMNKLEQGVANMKGGALTVCVEINQSNHSAVCNKTAKEMYDACIDGGVYCYTQFEESINLYVPLIILQFGRDLPDDFWQTTNIPISSGGGTRSSSYPKYIFIAMVMEMNSPFIFTAFTDDDYPTALEGGTVNLNY